MKAFLHLWLQQGVLYSGVSARRELTAVWTATIQNWNQSFTHIEHRSGAVGGEGWVYLIDNRPIKTPLLTPFLDWTDYFHLSWFDRLSPLCNSFKNLSDMRWAAFKMVAKQPPSVIEIATKSRFLLGNMEKPLYVRLKCRRKSYPLYCEHSHGYLLADNLIYGLRQKPMTMTPGCARNALFPREVSSSVPCDNEFVVIFFNTTVRFTFCVVWNNQGWPLRLIFIIIREKHKNLIP